MVKVFEVKKLNYGFSNRKLYKNLNFSIDSGDIFAVFGPSGIGKTTLLKLLVGLLEPHSGEIRFLGRSLHDISLPELNNLRRKMGMLFQSGALFSDLTIFENVAYPILEAYPNIHPDNLNVWVKMKLHTVGLLGTEHLMPHELSGGMGRRVAFVRAITLDPKVLFFDEPLVGQDPFSKKKLVSLIDSTTKELNTTSIVVTHDIEDILPVATKVMILIDQEIAFLGTPEELKTTESLKVKEFLSGALEIRNQKARMADVL